jgi:hypothetical protein
VRERTIWRGSSLAPRATRAEVETKRTSPLRHALGISIRVMASLAVRNGHTGFRRRWLSNFTSLWRQFHSKGGRCNRRQNRSFIRAAIRGSTFILPVANFSERGWLTWRREESHKLTQNSTARNRGNGTHFQINLLLLGTLSSSKGGEI